MISTGLVQEAEGLRATRGAEYAVVKKLSLLCLTAWLLWGSCLLGAVTPRVAAYYSLDCCHCKTLVVQSVCRLNSPRLHTLPQQWFHPMQLSRGDKQGCCECHQVLTGSASLVQRSFICSTL
jgi:hypothetical protein